MHPGPVGERRERSGRGVEQEHLLLGGVPQPGLDQQPALVYPGHAADLEAVAGQRRAVDREGAGITGGVGGGQHPPVGEAGGGAGEGVHPLRVHGAGQFPGPAGGRVGAEQQHRLLEPVLDGQQDLPVDSQPASERYG